MKSFVVLCAFVPLCETKIYYKKHVLNSRFFVSHKGTKAQRVTKYSLPTRIFRNPILGGALQNNLALLLSFNQLHTSVNERRQFIPFQ